MPYKFELYKDRAGGFRVRFKAPNGENMFATESYTAKAAATNAIKSIMKNTPNAAVDDLTKEVKAAKGAKSAKAPKTAKKKAKKAKKA